MNRCNKTWEMNEMYLAIRDDEIVASDENLRLLVSSCRELLSVSIYEISGGNHKILLSRTDGEWKVHDSKYVSDISDVDDSLDRYLKNKGLVERQTREQTISIIADNCVLEWARNAKHSIVTDGSAYRELVSAVKGLLDAPTLLLEQALQKIYDMDPEYAGTTLLRPGGGRAGTRSDCACLVCRIRSYLAGENSCG